MAEAMRGFRGARPAEAGVARPLVENVPGSVPSVIWNWVLVKPLARTV